MRIAAVLALTIALFWLAVRTPKNSSDQFRSFVADTTATLDHLDLQTNNVAVVRNWLASRHAPGNFTLPSKLDGKPSLGCRVFDWKGRPVSLVCFRLENDRVAHLFIIERAGLNEPSRHEAISFKTLDGITTASWNDERALYVAAMRDGGSDLERLFL
jgi:hypothetical protein